MLALLFLQFAQKRIFEFGPVVGQNAADAFTAIGEGKAGGEFGADGAAGDQVAFDQPSDPAVKSVEFKADMLGQIRLGGPTPIGEHKQNRVVTRLEAALDQRHQQPLVGQLPGFDEPIKG